MSCSREYRIINATVEQIISHALCSYFNGSSIDYTDSAGAYGYNDNILWVTKGCRATFLVCYTDRQQPTSAVTNVSTSPTETTEPLDSTPLSIMSAELSITDHTPPATSYAQTSKWRSSEPHRQGPSGLMTVLIVVSLLLIVGCLILVIVLIRKRQRRQRLLENQKKDDCIETKERAPYEERAAECYYETISDEDAYTHLKSSEGNSSNCFVLEPRSRHLTSVDADALSDNKALTTTQTDDTQTKELRAAKDDSHTYFVVEPQSKSSSDESMSPRDGINSKGNTMLRSADFNTGVLNMASEDTYTCIDDAKIAVQSLADNEYNVLQTKSKNTGNQHSYDSFQSVQHEGNMVENNECSKNENSEVTVQNINDYAHIQ